MRSRWQPDFHSWSSSKHLRQLQNFLWATFSVWVHHLKKWLMLRTKIAQSPYHGENGFECVRLNVLLQTKTTTLRNHKNEHKRIRIRNEGGKNAFRNYSFGVLDVSPISIQILLKKKFERLAAWGLLWLTNPQGIPFRQFLNSCSPVVQDPSLSALVSLISLGSLFPVWLQDSRNVQLTHVHTHKQRTEKRNTSTAWFPCCNDISSWWVCRPCGIPINSLCALIAVVNEAFSCVILCSNTVNCYSLLRAQSVFRCSCSSCFCFFVSSQNTQS